MDSDLREKIKQVLASQLEGSYDCRRVWGAWSVGTMRKDDFTEIGSDDDRLDEILDAVMAVIPTWQPIERAPKYGDLILIKDVDGNVCSGTWNPYYFKFAKEWMPIP